MGTKYQLERETFRWGEISIKTGELKPGILYLLWTMYLQRQKKPYMHGMIRRIRYNKKNNVYCAIGNQAKFLIIPLYRYKKSSYSILPCSQGWLGRTKEVVNGYQYSRRSLSLVIDSSWRRSFACSASMSFH